MASQSFSRKRPAPGADPVPYPAQMQNPASALNNGMGQQLSNDQFLQWGQSAQPASGSTYNENSYAMNANSYPQNNPQNGPQPSNQLTRRPMAQLTSLVPQPNQDGNIWPDTPNGGAQPADADWGDDIAELEARAQVAKKESQSKRKQIPPFVQKLNSFLEDGRNTELIRWSDEGNSFIVLDEDEFAKTLIPELFKHNNYASFVRQLNMYGFHKKVGLSDNSMRASEKKNKSPSEYSNPYFRRGHPDLLWLIQKPKNVSGPTTKRKGGKSENEQNDDEVDEYVEDTNTTTDSRVRAARPGQLTLGGDTNEMALTQDQFKSVQRELAAIRHQQTHISRMMGQIKREHEQLYSQATTFQDQHNRHENSINAILTFLATIYNRNLQGNDTIQGIANLFQNAMPVDTSTSGTVVDVGDYNFNDISMDGSPAKPFKRQPLLLTNGTGAAPSPQSGGRANTLSPRTTANNSPYPSRAQPMRTSNQSTSLSPKLEEVFDPGTNDSPRNLTPSSATSQSRPSATSGDMMSVIQSANARNSGNSPTSPAQDFSSVLSSLENSSAQGPLTNTQRADMLRLINNSAGNPSSSQAQDNALVNSTPPPGPANFHRRLASTQADFDHLARLQEQQDKSVQNLTNLLQPLSPSGSIPGIHDNQSLPPPPLDIDDFLNHNEYFADFPGSDGNNGSYDFGNTGLNQGGGTGDLNFEDYKEDDELFGNLDSNNNNAAPFGFDGANDLPPATNQYATNTAVGAGNMAGVTKFDNTAAFDEQDGGGRVESVPSSEVTTPKSDVDRRSAPYDNGEGNGNGVANRGKGRKLSGLEEGSSGRKRVRARA